MKRKLMGFVLAALIVLPVVAVGAQAELDCWMEAPLQTVPGDSVDGLTQEYVQLLCRNKGDAGATGISCVFTDVAQGDTSPWVPWGGSIGVSNDITTTVVGVSVDSDVLAGSTMQFTLKCDYNNGTANTSEEAVAYTSVVVKPERTLIHDCGQMGQWHPGENKLLYMDQDNDDLMVYDVETETNTKLTFDETEKCDSHPVWSWDGDRIAWQRENYDDRASIWIMNADGSDPRKILDNGYQEDFNNPNWTPDGRIIARQCEDEDEEYYYLGSESLKSGALKLEDYPDSVDFGALYYIADDDGSDLTRITGEVQAHYMPFSDVQGDYVMLRGGQDTFYWIHNLMIFDYNEPEGDPIALISGTGITDMGDIRPGKNEVVYKDGMNEDGDAPLFRSKFDNTKRECLTCETRVEEYQLSDNATRITLDYGYYGIVDIEGVWKANDPEGTEGQNFWNAEIGIPIYNAEIELAEPLDADSASARVPVIVTYTYVPDSCYKKPHYDEDGEVIVYNHRHDYNSYSQSETWLMRADGSNKQRITFWDWETYDNRGRTLPQISHDGRYVAVTNDDWSGCSDLWVIELPDKAQDLVDVDDDDDDDDDDTDCSWTIAGGGMGNVYNTLLVFLPFLGALGVRGLMRIRRKR